MEKIPTSQALGNYSGFPIPIKIIGTRTKRFVRNDILVHFSANCEADPYKTRIGTEVGILILLAHKRNGAFRRIETPRFKLRA
jgi:hypothetical protein